jgi:DNA-binding HxlR family transcriptional regulator
MTKTEALILLYVKNTANPVTVDDIVTDLPISRLTLYAVLPDMAEQGRVERVGDRVFPAQNEDPC